MKTSIWDGQRFAVGQRVRLSAGPPDVPQRATPTAIIGAVGVVTKPNAVSVWVRFDSANPARVAGRLLKVDACNLEASPTPLDTKEDRP